VTALVAIAPLAFPLLIPIREGQSEGGRNWRFSPFTRQKRANAT
jgi:hypothetical protein